jgi:repressor LexA
MKELTKKQKEILDYLKSYYEENGFSPTLNEVAKAFHISISTVQGHFKELVYRGAIKKVPNRPRSIIFKHELPKNMTVSTPILGEISAGGGIDIFEDPEPDFIEVPSEWLKGQKDHNYYCLRVTGFSMFEDGILDKDIIVARKQDYADEGDIVIAAIKDFGGEKATLKRYYKQGQQIELRPSNPNLESIIVNRKDFDIRGKFIGLIRSTKNT